MKELELHPTQQEALDFMVDSVVYNKEIIALIGAGGTGKSEILSRFKDLYQADDKGHKEVYFAATTNKAVSRLKADIPDTTTLHSAVAKPKYKPLYDQLCDYFDRIPNKEDKTRRKEFEDNFNFLQVTKNFLHMYMIDIKKFDSHLDIIYSLDMGVFDEPFFDRYIVKEKIYGSVVLIDESSMLSTKSEYKDGSLIVIGVDTAMQVFDNVILVGDSSQLPPISGKSSFDGVESYELTKNFRSEVDLLDAIQWAREGKSFWNYKSDSPNVKVLESISDEWYARTYGMPNVAHICYRNKTRHTIVKKVRSDKGTRPIVGEPVILRGGSQGNVCKGEIGVYNGKEIEFESGDIKLRPFHYFDEYEKNKYSIFQYAYSITCHMAQGSSFDHVIVHAYDMPYFIDEKVKIQWMYTAISRARKSITVIL